MTLIQETLGSLTITVGQTTSNTLGSQLSAGQLKTALNFLDALSLYAPQGYAEDIIVQLSPVENPAETDWINYTTISLSVLEDLLDELAIPLMTELSVSIQSESTGSSKVTTFEVESFKDLRLVAQDATAATRTFKLLAKLSIAS